MKSRGKKSDLWILNSWKDLSLFVLSPLWVIPLVWMAKSRFDPQGFGAVILAVGGTGHHLPGFIRAYTDPVLFRRYRLRFILAPILLFVVYASFFTLHLDGLKLLLVLWGTWHGAMQVNGFLRIYDSKVGSFSKATAWLDRAMCIVWFGGALLYSSRLIVILSHFFKAGGAPVSPGAFVFFRYLWMAAAVSVTLAFAINAVQRVKAGSGPNPVKILMIISSVALWWFAMVGVNSLLVGLLLFEVVHDVQYNALVWIYNKRRVSQGMTASRLEKFLFQPSSARAFLYLALILGYGALADVLEYANIQAPDVLQIGSGAVSFWTGLFMVSTFLHFYFDGFIWQVKEGDFRKGLAIEDKQGAAAVAAPRYPPLESLATHWKWLYFLVPAAVLAVCEYGSAKVPFLDQARNMVALLPDRWQTNAVVGSLEKVGGDETDALTHLERAVALNPSFASGYALIADIHARQGRTEAALEHYRKALEINALDYSVHARLGKMLVNLGRHSEAIPHLKAAVDNGQTDGDLFYVLGASLVKEKRALEGIPYLHYAIRLDPRNKQAMNYVGIAFQQQGDLRSAAESYRAALEVDPGYAPAKENLDRVTSQLQPGTTF
jgi:tetratricopeptide (TPR) repeat protein